MQYTAWLKWGVIVGLCACLFTVFIIADGVHFPINMFFPFITGKNFTFRILVEIVLALYVVLAVREPKYRPRSSMLMWALGLFVVWMALATVFSVDPVKSFWSNFERMDGYITLLHMFALFIVASVVLTAEKWWEKFFQISVAVSVLMAIYGIFQAFGIFGFAPSSQSGPRADGTFGNAIYLAVFMLFNIFLALFLLVRERKASLSWWIYGVAIVLQCTTLYYTETRGALLGVVGGVIVAALYTAFFGGPQWKQLRKYSLWGIGIIVVLALIFIGVRNTSFVKSSDTLERFASLSLSDRTTQARLTIWQEALQGIKEKPLIGWGQENFNFVFNKFYNPTMWDQEQWFDRAHNAFLDWATAGGIPALLLYVSLFVLAVWAFFKSELEVPEQAVFIGLIAAYAFNNLTVFDNLSSYMYFFILLAFAHSLSRKELHSWMFMSKPLSDKSVAVVAPIVLIVLVWGGWALNAPGIARAQTLITALTTQDPSTGAAIDPSVNLAAFQKALAYGPYLGYQETVEQLFQFSSNNVPPSSGASPAVQQQAYALTVQAGNALLAQRPHDARLELFYGVFLDQFGQYPGALTQLEAADADSPQKQSILFELGSTYLVDNNPTDGLATFKQAYEEDTTDDDARTYYAAALYETGQNAAADALLIQRFGTTTVDSQQLIQAYLATKQYARLASIYELRLQANPDDPQSLVDDAIATYFANGNKAHAVAELQKAATADPADATQIQSLIDQVNKGTLTP